MERPDGLTKDDDEFDAYRKRMMLAYRFRPNPLVGDSFLSYITVFDILVSWKISVETLLKAVLKVYFHLTW